MSHEQDQTNAAAGGDDATLDDPSSPFDGAEEGDLNAPSSSINLEKADRSLSEFKRWYDEGDLVLDPEWQRNYVWNRSQASKLIESFLLSIPVPVVYLSRTRNQGYEVIDGLQRLRRSLTSSLGVSHLRDWTS